MMRYISWGEISYAKCRESKKSKRFSLGCDFTEQIFTGEIPRVDSTGVLREGVIITVLWFNLSKKIIDKTANRRPKKVEIMVPLKYSSNFWKTLGMPLVNCEINLILTWIDKCLLSNDKKATTFVITNTKLYVPVATLSTQDNAKLPEKLKSGFKRTINWKKYDAKVSVQTPNPY